MTNSSNTKTNPILCFFLLALFFSGLETKETMATEHTTSGSVSLTRESLSQSSVLSPKQQDLKKEEEPVNQGVNPHSKGANLLRNNTQKQEGENIGNIWCRKRYRQFSHDNFDPSLAPPLQTQWAEQPQLQLQLQLKQATGGKSHRIASLSTLENKSLSKNTKVKVPEKQVHQKTSFMQDPLSYLWDKSVSGMKTLAQRTKQGLVALGAIKLIKKKKGLYKQLAEEEKKKQKEKEKQRADDYKKLGSIGKAVYNAVNILCKPVDWTINYFTQKEETRCLDFFCGEKGINGRHLLSSVVVTTTALSLGAWGGYSLLTKKINVTSILATAQVGYSVVSWGWKTLLQPVQNLAQKGVVNAAREVIHQVVRGGALSDLSWGQVIFQQAISIGLGYLAYKFTKDYLDRHTPAWLKSLARCASIDLDKGISYVSWIVALLVYLFSSFILKLLFKAMNARKKKKKAGREEAEEEEWNPREIGLSLEGEKRLEGLLVLSTVVMVGIGCWLAFKCISEKHREEKAKAKEIEEVSSCIKGTRQDIEEKLEKEKAPRLTLEAMLDSIRLRGLGGERGPLLNDDDVEEAHHGSKPENLSDALIKWFLCYQWQLLVDEDLKDLIYTPHGYHFDIEGVDPRSEPLFQLINKVKGLQGGYLDGLKKWQEIIDPVLLSGVMLYNLLLGYYLVPKAEEKSQKEKRENKIKRWCFFYPVKEPCLIESFEVKEGYDVESLKVVPCNEKDSEEIKSLGDFVWEQFKLLWDDDSDSTRLDLVKHPIDFYIGGAPTREGIRSNLIGIVEKHIVKEKIENIATLEEHPDQTRCKNIISKLFDAWDNGCIYQASNIPQKHRLVTFMREYMESIAPKENNSEQENLDKKEKKQKEETWMAYCEHAKEACRYLLEGIKTEPEDTLVASIRKRCKEWLEESIDIDQKNQTNPERKHFSLPCLRMLLPPLRQYLEALNDILKEQDHDTSAYLSGSLPALSITWTAEEGQRDDLKDDANKKVIITQKDLLVALKKEKEKLKSKIHAYFPQGKMYKNYRGKNLRKEIDGQLSPLFLALKVALYNFGYLKEESVENPENEIENDHFLRHILEKKDNSIEIAYNEWKTIVNLQEKQNKIKGYIESALQWSKENRGLFLEVTEHVHVKETNVDIQGDDNKKKSILATIEKIKQKEKDSVFRQYLPILNIKCTHQSAKKEDEITEEGPNLWD